MNTDQHALAAFIDSCQGLLCQKRIPTGTVWRIEKFCTALEMVSFDYEIRIAPGQLDPFGIPHSLSHLIHNPAGLSAKDITGLYGDYRIAIPGDIASTAAEKWSRPHGSWKPIPPKYIGERISIDSGRDVTIRLPALTPLPKVEAPTNEPPKHDELEAGSQTPRTDAAEYPADDGGDLIQDPAKRVTPSPFARTLETELKESQARELALREALEKLQALLENLIAPSRLLRTVAGQTIGQESYRLEYSSLDYHVISEAFAEALSTLPPPVVWREDADKLARAIADTLPGMKAQAPPKLGTFNWPHYADVMEKALEAYRAKLNTATQP